MSTTSKTSSFTPTSIDESEAGEARDFADTDVIVDSLDRVAQQIREVARMVEGEQPIDDVLAQLSAVIAATRRVGLVILENRVDVCLATVTGDQDALERLHRTIECLVGRAQRA